MIQKANVLHMNVSIRPLQSSQPSFFSLRRMGLRLSLLGLFLLPAAPCLAKHKPTPEPDSSTRSQLPWLIDFGGGFPNLPGIALSYNLTPQFAVGLHGGYLYILNSLSVNGRFYMSKEPGSFFGEVGMTALGGNLFYSGAWYCLSGMLGYEYRSDSGFNIQVGAGLTAPVMASFYGSPSFLLPALQLSLGKAF